MLQVDNLSPFAHIDFGTALSPEAMADVLVVKALYELQPSEGTDTFLLKLFERRDVISVAEECFGEMNQTSPRSESDLAPIKPRCDVVVIGSAHSPTGQPVREIDVGIDLDRGGRNILSHGLKVHGARQIARRDAIDRGAAAIVWAATLGTVDAPQWYFEEAESFLDLPLRYEHAFGGQLRVYESDDAAARLRDEDRLSQEIRTKHPEGDAAPVAHKTCLVNPFGCGFAEKWHAEATKAVRYPAPRIEASSAPFTAELFEAVLSGKAKLGSEEALSPQGFGVIAKSWQPRLALAGTYDAAWRETVWPYSPGDFNEAFWNGANPHMQCEYLSGGESVSLRNMLPHRAPGTCQIDGATIARFSLPKTDLVAQLAKGEGPRAYVKLPIDTLTIDLDAMTVSTVWRLRIPESSGIVSAALMVVDVESGRQRLAAKKAVDAIAS